MPESVFDSRSRHTTREPAPDPEVTEAPEPTPSPDASEDVVEETQVAGTPELPEGAVSSDHEPTKEEIVASAMRPGPTLVAETAVEEAVEEAPQTVTVALDIPEGYDIDEVTVQVPGLDPEADYVEVIEGITAIRLSGELELPAHVGNLVAESAYAKVAE